MNIGWVWVLIYANPPSMDTSADITMDDNTTHQDMYDLRPDPIWFDIIDQLGRMGLRDAQKVLSSTSKELTTHFRSNYTTTILPSTLFGCVVEGSTPPLIMRPLCVEQRRLESGRLLCTTSMYVVMGCKHNNTKLYLPCVRIIKLTTDADISADIANFRNTKLGINADKNKIPCGSIDMIVDIYPYQNVCTRVFEVSREQIATEYTSADRSADKTTRRKCAEVHHIATRPSDVPMHIDNLMEIMVRRMHYNLSTGFSSSWVGHLPQRIRRIFIGMGLDQTLSSEVAEFVAKVATLTESTLFINVRDL